MNKKIGILGCGWLGLPLAKQLIKENYSVFGSATSKEKCILLEKEGISAFEIILHEKKVDKNLIAFLSSFDTLIIAVPPRARTSGENAFLFKLKLLISELEKANIKNVLFISSTAVYGDYKGVVSETTTKKPTTAAGKQLVAIEQLLTENTNFKTTILRFAGLIGLERHPIKQLSGKTNIKNPNAPINLIHLDDCIAIIFKIIEQEMWNTDFNAAYPNHPTRKNYYTKEAIKRKLPLPNFSHEGLNSGKIIDATKLSKTLDYNFSVEI